MRQRNNKHRKLDPLALRRAVDQSCEAFAADPDREIKMLRIRQGTLDFITRIRDAQRRGYERFFGVRY